MGGCEGAGGSEIWAEEATPPLPLAVSNGNLGDAVGFSLNPFMMSLMKLLREGGVASDCIEEGGGGDGDRAWITVA